jgi:3-hydroxyisobutyrate dehydrogenase-like beta-hydroxyacid dehydrogenase
MSTPPSSTAAVVGFVGLGMMGAPIAERLRSAGHPLIVYNRTRTKAEPLLAAGARWAFSPKDVGRESTSGIVFTMLSDARAEDRILFGRNGLAPSLPSGALVVDLTTIAPSESREFARRLSEHGIQYVDAPVGGSVDPARNGRLIVFAGGSEQDVARARPLLEAFGRRIDHLGPVGAGTSMKLVSNLLTMAYVAAAAEAIALAEGLGLDRHKAIELFLDGTGYSRLLEQKRMAFEERRYPAQFQLRLAEKDLKLIAGAARDAGRAARIAREAERLVREGVRAGRGEDDFAVMLEAALARRARRVGPSVPEVEAPPDSPSAPPSPPSPTPPAPAGREPTDPGATPPPG